ncbi:MAG: hypothetical protein WDW36_009639 [Sanguina aurantia]
MNVLRYLAFTGTAHLCRWQVDAELESVLAAGSAAVHSQAQCLQALRTLGSSGGPLLQPSKQLRELLPTALASPEERGGQAADGEELVGAELRSGSIMLQVRCAAVAVQLSRVLLTPTRVKLQPAEPEMSNRVVRHFCSHGFLPRDFLRASCGEEDGRKLYSPTASAELSAVYQHVQAILNDGLTILGRQYQFLAYSSSQLKEQSVWMVHCPPGHSPDTMRSWMGDSLTSIKIPAKCAARMGQCFSTTAPTVEVERWQQEEIPDIQRNGHCFSDGVGEISLELLRLCLAEVSFGYESAEDVSAIQVRFQGMKGVLCLNPNLQGKVLRYRRSMQKFVSSHSTLEVVSVAARIPCFLNRFLIILLVGNGISRTIFEDMQLQLVRQLDTLLSGNASLALAALLKVRCGDSMCQDMLVTMLTAGLSAATDPLLKRCLEAVRMHLMMDLKHKARIPVSKGVVLMGGLDHTELLPEKTVFLQVQEQSGPGGWRIVRGRVLLAKHPVMHPGDLQVVLAEDIPELHCRRNELVFSRKGSRPLPNMLSGSDLDGDQYAVIWDPSLIPEKPNQTPMDYSPQPPTEVARVTVPHLIQHFIDHAKNDNLGQIANAWLVYADRTRDSTFSAECLRLAELYATAVDFPKTGVPAVMDRKLVADEVPHFMENKVKTSYTSTSVLGCMYDQVVKNPALLAYRSTYLKSGGEELLGAQPDQRIANIPGRQRFQRLASEESDMYQRDMMQLMNKYHLSHEGEMLTGCIVKYHRLQKRKQHETKQQVAAEAAAYYMTSYPARTRQECTHPTSPHPAAAEQQPPPPSSASQLGASPATASAAPAHAADVPGHANAPDTRHHAAPAHLPAQTAAVAAAEAGCGVGSFGALGGVSQQGGFAHQGDDSDDEDREDEEADDARAGRGALVLYSFPWVVAAEVLGGYLRGR